MFANEGRETCSGTVVHDCGILTAAHCIGTGESFIVDGHSHTVDKSIPREGVDLAIVTIRGRFDLANKEFYPLGEGVPAKDSLVTVKGYGQTETGSFGTLKRGEMRVIGLGPVPGGSNQELLRLAMTDKEQTVCPGDSGGPTLQHGRLVGVHSTGNNRVPVEPRHTCVRRGTGQAPAGSCAAQDGLVWLDLRDHDLELVRAVIQASSFLAGSDAPTKFCRALTDPNAVLQALADAGVDPANLRVSNGKPAVADADALEQAIITLRAESDKWRPATTDELKQVVVEGAGDDQAGYPSVCQGWTDDKPSPVFWTATQGQAVRPSDDETFDLNDGPPSECSLRYEANEVLVSTYRTWIEETLANLKCVANDEDDSSEVPGEDTGSELPDENAGTESPVPESPGAAPDPGGGGAASPPPSESVESPGAGHPGGNGGSAAPLLCPPLTAGYIVPAPCMGCTDPWAENWSPTAIYDDGSCWYLSSLADDVAGLW